MNILTVDYQAENAAELFSKSLKETGFGVLVNHPITDELIDKVYNEWQEFFARPEEEKRKYLFKRDYEQVQDGFFPMDVAETAKGFSIKDLKEFYHAYACKPLPEGINSSTMELRNQLFEIGKTMLNWLQQELPEDIRSQLSMPLADMADAENQTLLRILHYPPLTGDYEEGAVRAAPHEDINLITLLISATAPGLQVQNTKGEWYSVPCTRNAIAINSGDMLQECTQFYYKATKHRVVNPVGEEAQQSRFSIPLFIHPSDDVVLSERYTAGSYLKERLTELGLISGKEKAEA